MKAGDVPGAARVEVAFPVIVVQSTLAIHNVKFPGLTVKELDSNWTAKFPISPNVPAIEGN